MHDVVKKEVIKHRAAVVPHLGSSLHLLQSSNRGPLATLTSIASSSIPAHAATTVHSDNESRLCFFFKFEFFT